MPSQTESQSNGETETPFNNAQHREDNCSCFSTNPENYNNSFHAIKQDKGEAWSEHFSVAR